MIKNIILFKHKMSLSKAQVVKIVEDVFRKYDKNNNNFLEWDQVQKMLQESFERLRKTTTVD